MALLVAMPEKQAAKTYYISSLVLHRIVSFSDIGGTCTVGRLLSEKVPRDQATEVNK